MENLNVPKLIKLEKNNTLFLELDGLKERQYGISVKYYNHKEDKPKKRIDYITTIYVHTHTDGWLIDIKKSDIYFNQHEPDSVNENISNIISKAIYPVQTYIDKFGIPIDGITNHKQILNRWHKSKLAISKKYVGEATNSVLNYFDKKIANKNLFELSMDYDMFWNLLFHSKYISYQDNLSINTILRLAVIPYHQPLEFSGTQKINLEITNYNSIQIDFISDETDAHEYFMPEVKDSDLKYLMRLNVFFDLDTYYFFPMHIRAYFEVFSKDSNGSENVLKRINFTQYQQNTEENKKSPSEKKSPFQVYEDDDKVIFKTYGGKNYTFKEWKIFEEEQYKLYKEKKQKKSFWDSLG